MPSTTLFEAYCSYAPKGVCFVDADTGFWPLGLRVGDLLELPYFTAGPFPAGNYVVTNGLGGPRDARLHLDLVHRLSGGGDSVFASADVGAGAGSDGGAPGAWSTTLAGPALASTCGDQLVLRVQLVSAASPYLEFLINMTTP